MFTLLKKEFSGFFSSPTGYVIIGIFLLLTGLFLWVFPGEYNVFDSGYAQLDGLFSLAPWLYLFLVPAVTMRTFAEEKQSGTFELIVTRPISTLQIVAAKYLAAVLLILFSLLPTLLYYLAVYYLAQPVGNVDSGAIFGSYIGLFFLASVYAAIGVFASSLSSNQLVSFVLTVVLCFFFYYGWNLLASLGFSGATENILIQCGIDTHYTSMSRGVIDSRDVLYFLSVIVIFVYGTVLKIRR
jgi:ABC-2 type transport system permease protein